MAAIIPTHITLEQHLGRLTIQWANERVCYYPVGPLRLACPCAECRGGHQNMGRHNEPSSLADLIPLQPYQIVRMELVGNYALQFFWDDGHHTGIYTWDYLYRLCPDEENHD